jgi:hypothetical protein
MQRDHHLLASLALSMALVGCTASGLPETGSIELGLVSASSNDPMIQIQTLGARPQVAGIFASILKIDAHVASVGWVPVLATPVVVDLTKLDSTKLSSLGIGKMPAGHVVELRLFIEEAGSYVLLKDGSKKPLQLPDGGIVKVVGPFRLAACATGTIIMDFDAKLKIEEKNGQLAFSLKCVAHIKTVKTHGACEDGGAGAPDLAKQPDLAKPDGGNSCVGVVCMTGEICQNGICVGDPCNGVVCAPGEVCSNGICGQPSPCTGVVCSPGETCSNGMCVPSTPPDMRGPTDMRGSDGMCNR